MGTNFYLAKSAERIVGDVYRESEETITAILQQYGVTFASPEAQQECLQEILERLGISNVTIFGGISERGEHLGKRSAAGMYCYTCDVSLVTGKRGGMNAENPHCVDGAGYHSCPHCGAEPSGNWFNPELFTPTREQQDTEEQYAVRYSHSFSFALSPETIAGFDAHIGVVDEYERHLTMTEFRRSVIGTAKFLFTHHVGSQFS